VDERKFWSEQSHYGGRLRIEFGQSPGWLSDFGPLLAGLGGLIVALVGVLQYFQTHREKVAAARKSFDSVVSSLASENEVDRLAGAILLRRFFDPNSEVATTSIPFAAPLRRFFDRKSEVSTRDTPYATEAVNVIAAILRNRPTGNFQKLLADGLAFAPSLSGADLQRTNLNNAYLGARDLGARDKRKVDLRKADFFRADLTEASLKESDAQEAVFYQARLTNAVLREAKLRKPILSKPTFTGRILTART
jgi:Pentapeptide repeats (8 copies)